MEDIKYNIIRAKTRRISAKLNVKTGCFDVRVPLLCTNKSIDEFLNKFRNVLEKDYQEYRKEKAIAQKEKLSEQEIREYKKTAPEVFRIAADKYAEMLGVKYSGITIRMQKTRWGSCSSSGHLNFNVLLLAAPENVLESVVAHEICHIKQMNHGKKFYENLAKIFPGYKECSKWLHDNGRILQMKFGLF